MVARALLLGLAVGIVSGLFGIGGGALIVLGLLALGFSQHQAHATSLSTIALTATAAVIPFALAGEVAPLASVVLAATAMTGAFLGAGIMHRIPERRLRLLFGLFLLVIAARMIVGVSTPADGVPTELGAGALAGLAVLGLVTGLLSSILGVGGGLVLVPALVLLFGFSQHGAEGTSLAVVIPTALVGAYRHTRRGYTRWSTGLTVGAGGLAGGLAGATVALALDGIVLQRLFGLFLALMTVRMLRRP